MNKLERDKQTILYVMSYRSDSGDYMGSSALAHIYHVLGLPYGGDGLRRRLEEADRNVVNKLMAYCAPYIKRFPKPDLHKRLCNAFGKDAVYRELLRMVNPFNGDPLRHLTDNAKQELFNRLRDDLRRTKRNNAQNRRIAAERKAND